MGWDLAEIALEIMRPHTTSGREWLIEDFLVERLKEAGLEVRLQEVPGVGDNIIARRGEGGFLIVTHTDVYPYLTPEIQEPWVEDGVLYGRGAVDTKGQIAALLVALLESRGSVNVALVVDEELEGRGSRLLEIPPDAPGAVVLEPTDLSICTAEGGTLEVRVVTLGREAHGSTPWAGDNAVEKAIRLYNRLLSASFLQHRHPLFPRGAWVNIGRIEGGHDAMVVPSSCSMHLEIGFAPGLSAEAVEDEVEEILSEAETMEILDFSPPWETPPGASVITALEEAFRKALGREPKRAGMPSWTDGANLHKKGVPTVVFGAGKLEVAHTPWESVPLEELEALSAVLRELIEGSKLVAKALGGGDR